MFLITLILKLNVGWREIKMKKVWTTEYAQHVEVQNTLITYFVTTFVTFLTENIFFKYRNYDTSI